MKKTLSVLVVTDFRCVQWEGQIYLAAKHHTIVKRYAEAFGPVVLCCRSREMQTLPEYLLPAPFVSRVVTENSQMKALLGSFDGVIRQEVEKCDLLIVRQASINGTRAARIAQKLHKPYLAEIMSCPWDAYWNHSIVGKVIAPYMYLSTRKTMRNASWAIYVTEKFLQKRYPCRCPSIAASNVDIPGTGAEEIDVRTEKIANLDKKHFTIATTAAVDVRYKGQQYVIEALSRLKEDGIRAEYYLLGAGDQSYLSNVAQRCGVADQVHFCGELTHQQVMERLDKTDIYIQPSLQEGLPRALIEAMSRGCLALGSDRAGIPELLEDEAVFKPAASQDIVRKVRGLLAREDLVEMAKANIVRANQYRSEVLDERRERLFDMIRDSIEN